jgi:ATP-binding cassette subfamily F protein 3
MDEPTNHLDLDSKDVLLEALEDYGGTLILVSHDRYFVEKLANKIIEIGHGQAVVYPGTYAEFLWSKSQASNPKPQTPNPKSPSPHSKVQGPRPKAPAEPEARKGGPSGPPEPASRDERKRIEAERKKKQRDLDSLQKRIVDLEGRIGQREEEVKTLEAAIAAPGFYDDRDAAQRVIDRHQALMWEVGDLMAQWEALQAHASES